MKNKQLYLLFIFILFLLSGACNQSREPGNQELKNIIAFAKVYGHVKYFHPSDESREIDWDIFAITGVKKVKEAKNQKELKNVLEDLFKPIAPTIRITEAKPRDQSFLEEYLKSIPEDTSFFPTFWQHLGEDLEQKNSPYNSIRRYRQDKVVGRNVLVYQYFEKESLTGSFLRFKATVKAEMEGRGNRGGLYIRVDDEDGRPLLIKDADDISATSDWKELSARVGLIDNFKQITVGIMLNGDGKIWVDNVQLEVKDNTGEWETVSVLNPSFEEHTNGRPLGWRSTVSGNYDLFVTSDQFYTDSNSFYMGSTTPNTPVTLFTEEPELGETAIQKISDGLWSEVPLVLYADSDHTYPVASESALNRLKFDLNSINLDHTTVYGDNGRLANIIIAWNELQHFYPYFDVVDVDWNMQLQQALTESLSDQTPEDFFETLSKMLASTKDGHISLYHAATMNKRSARLPFTVDWIEDQVVVTNSVYDKIKPGDIVVTLDSIPSEDIVENARELISGSPQLSLYRAMRGFGRGERNTKVVLEIKNEKGIKTYHIQRKQYSVNDRKEELPTVGKIEDSIYYVNLDIASMKQINDEIEAIAASKGVIFDLRGYPNGNHQVISHLLSEPDTSQKWMQVPQILYPDQKNIIGFEEYGWELQQAEPHIQGDVVFITDSRAISYAESYMSFIEHYELAEIVGQPTAGTNGNINRTSLPGGYRYAWTGMKVLKHDGSQHHQIGIQPTVPVSKTIEGVREGKDEFLEKAIEILKASYTLSGEEAKVD